MIVQESLRVTWNNVFFDCDVSNPGENWGECYDKDKGKAVDEDDVKRKRGFDDDDDFNGGGGAGGGDGAGGGGDEGGGDGNW